MYTLFPFLFQQLQCNLDLLIADYYDRIYTLSINSTDLSLLPSASGQLSATVKLNDIVQSIYL